MQRLQKTKVGVNKRRKRKRGRKEKRLPTPLCQSRRRRGGKRVKEGMGKKRIGEVQMRRKNKNGGEDRCTLPHVIRKTTGTEVLALFLGGGSQRVEKKKSQGPEVSWGGTDFQKGGRAGFRPMDFRQEVPFFGKPGKQRENSREKLNLQSASACRGKGERKKRKGTGVHRGKRGERSSSRGTPKEKRDFVTEGRRVADTILELLRHQKRSNGTAGARRKRGEEQRF